MTNNFEKNGVSYSFIPSTRFKTTLISVGFYLPLSRHNAANALALSLMKSCTLSLPTTYALNRKLASLYGANISAWTSKVGDCQELRLGITVNDDKYSIHGEKTVDEAGELLCDMIFGYFNADAEYPDEAFSREQRLLCEAIAGQLNDKRTYARTRCEEIMCADEPYGLSPDGTVEDVKALTKSDVHAALKRIIGESFISVIIVGEKEPSFAESFMNCIASANRCYKPLPEDTVRPAGDVKTVEEKMPVKQGKLVLGLRSPFGGSDRETVAAWVMNDIFGGGPYSKLFCNVREKMSLCYYCSARPTRRKGIILVDSGVEDANIESAKTAILKQLSDMADGNFTEKEMTSSKLSMCDSILSAASDQATLVRWYASRSLESSPASPEEICELIKKVTVEDIKAAAKNFALDTVYVLRPDGAVKEEQ